MFKPDAIQQAAWRVLQPMLPDVTLYHAAQGDVEVTPYASLSVDSRNRQGQDTREAVKADGTQIYRGQRTGTLTVQVVGEECASVADELVNRLQMDSASTLFHTHGMVLHSATPVSFMPFELEGQQYLQMVAVDIQWRAQVRYSETVELIEVVASAYEIHNGGNEVIADSGVVIPVAGKPLPADVILVNWQQFDPALLKVGIASPLPSPELIPAPKPGSGGSADIRFNPADAVEVITSPDHHTAHWRFLKPGPVDVTFTWRNADGYHVSDTVTLQISP